MKISWGRREITSILLFAVALIPRVISPGRISVIPDQWRDYGEALAMLSGRYIPLLGIPSSVPRFSQGPLNVWFAAFSFAIGGVNPMAPVVAAALLTSLGIVLFYWLMRRYFGEGIAFLAALVWALSPAAITQSRVPFYLFAIPLFLVVYVEALLRLREGTKWAVFWAVFSFFLLFQWELATIPLIVLLPIALFRHKLVRTKYLPALLTGAALGLLPQILFDLTHRCQQLCTFVVWMGYRTAATTGFDGRHSLTAVYPGFWEQVRHQLQALVGFGSSFGLAVILGLTALGIVTLRRRLTELGLYAALGSGLLLVGLIVHGDPSEAYFPPFVILIPILAGFGLDYVIRLCKPKS